MGYGQYAGIALGLIVACTLVAIPLFLSSPATPSIEAADVTTSILIAVCGDGVIQSGQVCDDGLGNNTGAYASSTDDRRCLPDCSGFGPYCGDGILQVRFDEECDEGSNTETATCSASCKAKTPPPPGPAGSPTVGSIPSLAAPPGLISSVGETRVIVRGKAYPSATVNVLIDGEIAGTTQADINADFQFSTANVTPGTATFGFWARDNDNRESTTIAAVFEVAQNAVTTMSNIFIPPTIGVSDTNVPAGEPVTLAGQSVPDSTVTTEVRSAQQLLFESETDEGGEWALQLDTSDLPEGLYLAKSFFDLGAAAQSGFGRAVTFTIGEGFSEGLGSPDVNGDGNVNLVDFSIFLTDWGGSNARSDFNGDGSVNLADFSILLFQWTG